MQWSSHPGGSLSVLDLLAATLLVWGFCPQPSSIGLADLGKGLAFPELYSI